VKDDILKILKGSVITTTKSGVFIDKYRKGYICKKITTVLFKELYNIELIEMDSGNWETSETHYHLNSKYISIKNNIKYINLEKITKEIEENKHRLLIEEFYDAYFSIKKDIERNQKIKKLKDGILPVMGDASKEESRTHS